MKKTKILFCDDHPVFRLGLKSLFEAKGAFAKDAENGRDAVKKAVLHEPDLVVMDYMIPGMNGLDAIGAIRDRMANKGLNISYVLLTNIYDQNLVKKCRELNLNGYLSKSESLENICTALTRIQAGEQLFIEPRPHVKEMADTKNPFHALTKREFEVVTELVAGKTMGKIADGLCISVRTVGKHRENISRKLGIMSLPELTKKAFIWGLIKDNCVALR